MKDFALIEENLKSLNDEIEKFTESLEFQFVHDFELSQLNEDLLNKQIEKLDFQGIYFFEIKRGNEFEDFEKWKHNFRKKWVEDNINKSPAIASQRLNNHSEFNEWIPFYLGKSEKIQKRILEHISLPITSTTSALKLKLRTNFQKDTFRLSVAKIETQHYALVMHKIEQVLRKKHNPIVGKQ